MTALRRRVPAKLPPEFANSDFIRAIPVGTAIVADQRTQQRSFLIRLRPRMSHHAGSSAIPSALAEKRTEHVQVPISATQSSFSDRADVMRPTDGSCMANDGPLSPDQNIDQGRSDDHKMVASTIRERPNGPKVDPLSQLKDGNTAMIISSDVQGLSDRSAKVWKDRKFIVVSRTHPTVYPGIEGLRTEKVLWLSSTPSEISTSPNAIQDLLVDIGRSLDSPGKKAVLFVTCGGSPGESLSLMKGALEGRGVTIAAIVSFNRKELRDEGRVNDLIGQIRSVGTG
jgi:hypothetical protein